MAKFTGKPNNGFERSWQLVPVGGQKEVTLKNGSDLLVVDGGARLKIISLKETTAGGNHPLQRKFTISGLKQGRTAVWAKRGDKPAATLIVDVRPRRKVKVAFNYVESGEGDRRRGTKRSRKTARALLKKLNDIYLPQANVEFELVKAQKLSIKQELGDAVIRDQKTPSNDEFSLLVAERVPEAQINVFFVEECQMAGASRDTDGVAPIAISRNEKANCMVEDNLSILFENVVAHEVGHNLGLKDNYCNRSLLMYGKATKNPGTFLRREDIQKIWA